MKKLLIDNIPFKFTKTQILESIEKNQGRLIVQGPVQRAGAINQNGRKYPKPILEREATKYEQTEIAQNRALGELDHPESSVVNLRNASHNILQLEWKGDELWAKIEILNTPSGNILKELFKAGITLGISSRGLGSVNQLDEDTSEVQDDFQLICWDFVSNPSTQGAFMKPISEGKQIKIKETKEEKTERLIHEIICSISGVCCINKGK